MTALSDQVGTVVTLHKGGKSIIVEKETSNYEELITEGWSEIAVKAASKPAPVAVKKEIVEEEKPVKKAPVKRKR